jgi:hypothetical protein
LLASRDAGAPPFHPERSPKMTTPIESPSTAAKRDSGSNRRNNLVLRALIDEMLERVRELNRANAVWSTDERARAEAELDAIMARVRRVASQKHAS